MNIEIPSLSAPIFRRPAQGDAAAALERLSVNHDSQLVAFYHRYAGPLASPNTGFELLDLVDAKGQHSVESSTLLVRTRFARPSSP